MRRYQCAALATALLFVPCAPARAHDQDPKAILDKAIKALGGEEKLGKAEAFVWKAKGTINLNGRASEFKSQVTVKGLDHLRRAFGNDQFSALMVVDGEKGWRKVGENSTEMDGDSVAREKRNVYLQVIPITLVPLKSTGFKYEAGGEEKLGDKPAVVLKVTGPDGYDFTLYLDKESGVPVKEVAKIIDGSGREHSVETTFAEYKDFDGIKKATKIEAKGDGTTSTMLEITDFKVLDKVDPATFAAPK